MRFCLSILSVATLLAGAGMIVTATRAHGLLQSPGEAPVQRPAVQLAAPAKASPPDRTALGVHSFMLNRIDGRPMPLRQFEGQVVLLVNTASFCGFTPQYEGLERLQQRFADRGFTVLGVPSGDFMNQEYGDNAKIRDFCETKFGITFPMAEKAQVKGPRAIPLYHYIRDTLATDNEPGWNFHKFLIGKDGKPLAGFPSKVEPENPKLLRAIEEALAA